VGVAVLHFGDQATCHVGEGERAAFLGYH
jgi:hypothetical protein